jgi:hypothetical protein
MLAMHPRVFFTIPHFDGYAGVLIQLKSVTRREVMAAIEGVGRRVPRLCLSAGI